MLLFRVSVIAKWKYFLNKQKHSFNTIQITSHI